jgi:cytochrome bd-type quinol oxidase subunit 2
MLPHWVNILGVLCVMGLTIISRVIDAKSNPQKRQVIAKQLNAALGIGFRTFPRTTKLVTTVTGVTVFSASSPYADISGVLIIFIFFVLVVNAALEIMRDGVLLAASWF